MKYCKQFFCVLLVSVLLFATFSITVNAETNYKIELSTYYEDEFRDYDRQFSYPTDEMYFSIPSTTIDCDNSILILSYKIKPGDNGIIAKKGKNVTVTMSNVHLLLEYDYQYLYLNNFDSVRALLFYADGTTEYVNCEYSFNNPIGTFTSSFETKKDLNYIQINAEYWFNQFSNYQCNGFNLEIATNDSYIPNVDVEISSEESGLLKGLINWVKGIFESIGNGFSSMVQGFTDIIGKLGEGFTNMITKLSEGFTNMINNLKEGFTNIVNSLIELPQKLWTLISDGLKNLFVPDEDYISNYSEQWDSLLSSRFGAIYDVSNIIIDFGNTILNTDYSQMDTIAFPKVSLQSAGIPFEFGGYDVRIIPEGKLGIYLSNICKTILSIVCTFMFVNGLRKRYDEVMGVEQ